MPLRPLRIDPFPQWLRAAGAISREKFQVRCARGGYIVSQEYLDVGPHLLMAHAEMSAIRADAKTQPFQLQNRLP